MQTALAEADFLRALDALARGYQPVVVGYCSNLLGDPVRGEEVAQKAFVAAHEAIPGFRRQASVCTRAVASTFH